MKEITMVTTCEITTILEVTDEAALLLETNMDTIEKSLCDKMKSDLSADDVNILKNQIFIHDTLN